MTVNKQNAAAVAAAAFQAHKAGLSVLPPREDGSKAPSGGKWKKNQRVRPTEVEIAELYSVLRAGLGIVTGTISGNTILFEFDDLDTYHQFKTTAADVGLKTLVDRIENGYCEKTPGQGIHWLIRVNTVPKSQKLAVKRNDDNSFKTLIETKAEGGYAILAPSFGGVHPSSKPYELLHGGFETIAELDDDEFEDLITLAKSFDGSVRKAPHGARVYETSGRPGDDFNGRTTWPEVLEPHGWIFLNEDTDGVGQWQRPGKRNPGLSATANFGGSDLLWVFTTSSVFDANTGYSKFAAYAVLNHGGDYSAAAKALRGKGFGAATGHGHSPFKYPLTDYGNAERLVDAFEEGLRYCPELEGWYFWDGIRWVLDSTGEAMRAAKATVRMIREEIVDLIHSLDQERVLTWAKASESKARLTAMLDLAATELQLVATAAEFDRDLYLLTCPNGTIDLRTGTLREHRRSDLISKLCPVKFDHAAQSVLWEGFLDDATSDEVELRDFLKRAAGYSLTGSTDEECLFLLHGPEAAGKSSFSEALRSVLGDYAKTTDFDAFLQKTSRGVGNDIARLVGARVAIANEVDEGKRLSASIIKQVTGGDMVTCRFLFKEFFEFQPRFKLWFVANHAPLISSTDGAMWRRVHLIPMVNTIPPEKRDPKVKASLQKDPDVQEAILAWMVAGCLEWLDGGLAAPDVVIAATDHYRTEMNPLKRFVEERCSLNPNARVLVIDFRREYRDWAALEGEPIVNEANILSNLRLMNVAEGKGTNGVRLYRGISCG